MKFATIGILSTIAIAAPAQAENWVGTGIGYTVDRDGDTEETVVEIVGKVELTKFQNEIGVSVRPFVNTATELGTSVSLDVDVLPSWEVWVGPGLALRADEDSLGTLTGFDDDIVPYLEIGSSLDIKKDLGMYTLVRTSFDSKEGKEWTANTGLKINF